ncbi:hypothetical protein [Phenylobacterium sp.]|uniref:hypothetical protein n=1 Tax=Phenylobacterium sp. TaxID=1871053 RepID=UPI00345BD34D
MICDKPLTSRLADALALEAAAARTGRAAGRSRDRRIRANPARPGRKPKGGKARAARTPPASAARPATAEARGGKVQPTAGGSGAGRIRTRLILRGSASRTWISYPSG